MIGTALPQSVMFEAVRKQFNPDKEKPSWAKEKGKKTFGYYAVDQRVNKAQDWFLLHRWLDDYIYNSIVRPEIRKYAQGKGWNPFRFPESANAEIEAFGLAQMKGHYAEARRLYATKDQVRNALECEPNNDLRFDLPWNRAFEAEIEFSLKCDDKLILKP
jgi:hypothetical protein